MFSGYLTDAEVTSLIGERLKLIRIRARITRAELAESAGLEAKTIANIEEGKGFRSSTLIPVLRVLGLLEKLEILLPEPLPTIKSLKEITGDSTPRRVRKSKAERG